MSESEMEALLGRPLTPVEEANFDLYLDIAEDSLEDLTCNSFESELDATRTFDTRDGYSTAFVDVFTEVTEVKVNGTVKDTDDYSVRQWDKRTASWYNSLVFDCKFKKNDVIEVTGNWGFEPSSGGSELPSDLQLVLAGLFAQITKKNKYDSTIQSKQVEDFRITFNSDVDLDDAFYRNYGKIISKYSLCDIPQVSHGKVYPRCC